MQNYDRELIQFTHTALAHYAAIDQETGNYDDGFQRREIEVDLDTFMRINNYPSREAARQAFDQEKVAAARNRRHKGVTDYNATEVIASRHLSDTGSHSGARRGH